MEFDEYHRLVMECQGLASGDFQPKRRLVVSARSVDEPPRINGSEASNLEKKNIYYLNRYYFNTF